MLVQVHNKDKSVVFVNPNNIVTIEEADISGDFRYRVIMVNGDALYINRDDVFCLCHDGRYVLNVDPITRPIIADMKHDLHK